MTVYPDGDGPGGLLSQAHMADSPSTFGFRGYRDFVSFFVAPLVGGLLAWWFVATQPVSMLRAALTAALVPVGFIVVFGFGYAADLLPKRLGRHGPAREQRAAVLVVIFFGLAVLTVALILAYLALDDGWRLCPRVCEWTIRSAPPSPVQVPLGITHSGVGTFATAGTGAVLAGSVQLLIALVRPRRPLDRTSAPPAPFRRRVVARLLDIVILWAFSVGLFIFGSGFLLDRGLSWANTRTLLIVLTLLVPFLYEFLPGIWPRVRGKWWPGLQVVTAPDGDAVNAATDAERPDGVRVPPWRFALRAVITSVLFSPAVELGVLLWTLTGTHFATIVNVKLVFLAVVVVTAVIHSHGQGLHDVLLRTWVRRGTPDSPSSPAGGQRRDGGRQLRPSPLEVSGEDPFANDLLGCRGKAEALSAVIMSVRGPAAVMVDGTWGAGKTTFLRMCAAYLRTEGMTVVEFDAASARHTQRPALDMIEALSAKLPDADADRIWDGGGARLAAVLGIVTPDPRMESGRERREAVQDFTDSLKSVAAEHERLVLVVDELDRCPPNYALEALADIHQLLSVEGVVVLMGVNRDELCHLVRSVYGPRFGADGYLRRYADLHIDLPALSHTDLSQFVTHLLHEAGLSDRVGTPALRVLQLVAEVKACALRDLQQAVHLYALAVASDPPSDHPPAVWELSLAAMIVLRVADRTAYRKFVHGDIDNFGAVAEAYKSLGPDPILEAKPGSLPGYDRDDLAAALLNIGVYYRWCPDEAKTTEFHQRYRLPHDFRPMPRSGPVKPNEVSNAVLTQLNMLVYRQYRTPPGWRPLEVGPLADAIELAAAYGVVMAD